MLFHSLAEYRARGVPKKLPVADTVVNEWVVFIKNCGLMFGMRIFPHHIQLRIPLSMSGLYLLRIVALCLACVFFHTTCRFLSRNVVVKWKKHTDNSYHPCAFPCVCASPAYSLTHSSGYLPGSRSPHASSGR